MYKRILVPVDGSPPSDLGLAEAIRLAKLTQARLRIVHVIDEYLYSADTDVLGVLSGHLITEFERAGNALLEQARARAVDAGVQVETVLHEIEAGRVADRVIEEAKTGDADLIVLGTHGRRGVERVFLGSDAEQIARLAPSPVLLVRAAGVRRFLK